MHTQKSFKHLIQEAWGIFTGKFYIVLALSLLCFLPVEIGIAYLFPPIDAAMSDPAAPFSWETIYRVVMSLGALSLVTVVTDLFMTYAVKKSGEPREISIGEMFREGRRYLPTVLAMSIISGVLLSLLFGLLLIPGIIFMTYWTFAIPAIVMSGKKAIASLQQSRAVVRGRWWEVFGRMLVITLFLSAISFLLYSMIPLAYDIPLLDAFLSTILDGLGLSFTIFIALYYMDLVKAGPVQKKTDA